MHDSTLFSSTRSVRHRAACLLALLLVSGFAHAHSSEMALGGFAAGYLHPLSGVDHMLAMVAVGIWGAVLGAPLIWALPIAFPLLMVVGGALGIAGVPLPHVETGVALSVAVLGLAILTAWRAPVTLAVLVVGMFGVLHGYAHGTELPGSAQPAAFAAGFVVSTGLLHLAGIGIGMLKQVRHGLSWLRMGGAVITGIGVWLLAAMHGAA